MNKKILLISDTHRFLDHLPRLVKKYRRSVDLMIHCGDSALPKNDPIMSQFDIAVRGNHDEEAYPAYVKYEHILVTHGHLYNVYDGYDELISLCQKEGCSLCFHGHTHVPTIKTIQGITFINPGSTMVNRGSYEFGTYAIVNLFNDIQTTFYRSDTDAICSDAILLEGLRQLELFKRWNQKKLEGK
ncbi:YfcE family phosphodiesterase [uncultured Faecalicoccus sp.]|uniref:YfcE family phosphodiesterase n=1 Tax=uncultured Faecalicoccus sp. TaxID=1971760 RepID=UPI0025F94402|nr:YfcE family phosphodiesterase [uncultured Faecalicoccus sp.]